MVATDSQLDLDLIVTEGLGDTSYLLASDGEALLVDPQRDTDRFMRAAEARTVHIRTVLETHVHNDYVSGAVELAKETGAEIAAPARGGYRFPHRGLQEGEELRLGGLRLVAVDTPGHTPEHLAYIVYGPGSGEPLAVFTGGSLLVGSAGRTDLLGPDRTEELTRAQSATLRRLSDLPDPVRVLPTHGGGSFCVASKAGGDRTSTMGQEREYRSASLPGSVHVFVADLPARLDEVPRGRPVWAACASGHRSAMAASMLDGASIPVTLLAEGGIRDVLKRCGDGGG